LFQQIKQHFILNFNWKILKEIQQVYPSLVQHLQIIVTPLAYKEDQLIWQHSTSNELPFKNTYVFHKIVGQNFSWKTKSYLPPNIF